MTNEFQDCPVKSKVKSSGKKHIILLNPSSGRSRAIRYKEKLEELLQKYDVSYELVITKSEDDLRKLAVKKSVNARSLIAAGGDSTFTIMVNELIKAKKKIPVGIIPLGSSDDIALEYNIRNPEDAVKALKGEKTRSADIGEIKSGKNYVYYFPGQGNLGIGAYVNKYVAERPGSQTLRGISGIYHGFKTFRVPQEFTVEFNKNKFKRNLSSLLFSKIRFWAGGRIFLPEARIDDGKIHLLCIHSENPGDWFGGFLRTVIIMLRAQKGNHINHKTVKAFAAPEFKISSVKPFIIQVDGDIIKDHKSQNDLEFNSIKVGVIKKRFEVYSNEL